MKELFEFFGKTSFHVLLFVCSALFLFYSIAEGLPTGDDGFGIKIREKPNFLLFTLGLVFFVSSVVLYVLKARDEKNLEYLSRFKEVPSAKSESMVIENREDVQEQAISPEKSMGSSYKPKFGKAFTDDEISVLSAYNRLSNTQKGIMKHIYRLTNQSYALDFLYNDFVSKNRETKVASFGEYHYRLKELANKKLVSEYRQDNRATDIRKLEIVFRVLEAEKKLKT